MNTSMDEVMIIIGLYLLNLSTFHGWSLKYHDWAVLGNPPSFCVHSGVITTCMLLVKQIALIKIHSWIKHIQIFNYAFLIQTEWVAEASLAEFLFVCAENS